jgi:hypothetical protein
VSEPVDRYVRADWGMHKGKPVTAGNEVTQFIGVKKTYLRHVGFRYPTALDPDARDVVTFLPAVTTVLGNTGTIYVHTLRRDVAKDLYEALKKVFE